MPNSTNITAPFILFSYGRSGTTLLQECFNYHPLCNFCGETSELAVGAWIGAEKSYRLINVVSSGDLGENVDYGICGRAVRAVFTELFPTPEPYWLQKPIGLPIELLRRISVEPLDTAVLWYLNIYKKSFPDAKAFTILRNPKDVFVSAKKFWNFDDADILNGISIMASIVRNPASRIGHAVSYEKLVRDPEMELTGLCSYLKIPFNPAMLQALKTRHVGSKESDRTSADIEESFLHLVESDAEMQRKLDNIRLMWNKFGQDFPDFHPAAG